MRDRDVVVFVVLDGLATVVLNLLARPPCAERLRDREIRWVGPPYAG
jgi:hypothetical protein